MNSPVLTSPNTLIARVRAEMARRKISQSAASKEIGISAATLTQVLNGTYAADPAAQYEKLEKWLEQQFQAQAARSILPVTPGFISTLTAQRIDLALTHVHAATDMAIIYGGAGVGKTTALKHYRDSANNVWLATMSPATASVAAALEVVCLALDLKSVPIGAPKMHRAAVGRMVDTGGLLLIDEAQHLSIAALDEIRSLHDEAGIGVALVGNESLFSRVTGGNRDSHLAQLHSRIGRRIALRRPPTNDVVALAAAFGVVTPKEVDFLCKLAHKPGALRLVVKTLRLATMEAAGAVPALEHIEAAIGSLGV